MNYELSIIKNEESFFIIDNLTIDNSVSTSHESGSPCDDFLLCSLHYHSELSVAFRPNLWLPNDFHRFPKKPGSLSRPWHDGQINQGFSRRAKGVKDYLVSLG